MKMLLKLLALVLLLSSVSLNAALPHQACSLFQNENKKTEFTHNDPLKTKENFELIIKRITDMYTETIKALGSDLTLDLAWESDEPNAYAMQIEGRSFLYFNGGLYRHRFISEDAFALTVCHELGHILAGAPFVPGHKLSVEGQADFWATSVCMKKYFKEYPADVKVKSEISQSKCQAKYSNDPEAQNNCLRTAEAALSMAKFLASIGDTSSPKLEKRDHKQRSNTRAHHPEPQCRLDTYIAGSLCELDDTSLKFEEKLLNDKLISDFKCNEVVDGQMTTMEKRPKCWFNEINYGYSLDYLHSVKLKILSKPSSGTISVAYYNHLPGTYKIRLIPDQESARYIKITTPEFMASLPASGDTGYIPFNYKLTKKRNKKLKLKVEIEYNGKIIDATDNAIEIETRIEGLF